GETRRPVVVPIVNDALDEENETFTLNLSSASNAVIADDRGVATILDDDDPPLVSIDDVEATEGDSGSTLAAFTDSLHAARGKTVTVRAQTADGTATAGSDYGAVGPVTLTFVPGVTSQTVTAPVFGDTSDEPNETFIVTLTNPVNATIDKGEGIGTIVDDDG